MSAWQAYATLLTLLFLRLALRQGLAPLGLKGHFQVALSQVHPCRLAWQAQGHMALLSVLPLDRAQALGALTMGPAVAAGQ